MRPRHRFQRGAAIVEFALVFVILVILLFGLIETARALFVWNSAVQATRAGARTAAIAGLGAPGRAAVLAEMRSSMPELPEDAVEFRYSNDGRNFALAGTNSCVPGTCRFVQVSIRQSFHPVVVATPFGALLPDELLMPGFSTTVPVEALGVY